MTVQEAVAWKSTPAVLIFQDPPEDKAPTATHTWPALLSNVPEGPWNVSAELEPVERDPPGETGVVDHAVFGDAAEVAAASWPGENVFPTLNCPKYALSAGAAVTACAFMVRTGLENAMLEPCVGEQNAM